MGVLKGWLVDLGEDSWGAPGSWGGPGRGGFKGGGGDGALRSRADVRPSTGGMDCRSCGTHVTCSARYV